MTDEELTAALLRLPLEEQCDECEDGFVPYYPGECGYCNGNGQRLTALGERLIELVRDHVRIRGLAE